MSRLNALFLMHLIKYDEHSTYTYFICAQINILDHSTKEACLCTCIGQQAYHVTVYLFIRISFIAAAHSKMRKQRNFPVISDRV